MNAAAPPRKRGRERPWSPNGYHVQIEMKYRATGKQLRVVETPIVFVDRRVGQSKMSRAIVAEALIQVWRLRLRGR